MRLTEEVHEAAGDGVVTDRWSYTYHGHGRIATRQHHEPPNFEKGTLITIEYDREGRPATEETRLCSESFDGCTASSPAQRKRYGRKTIVGSSRGMVEEVRVEFAEVDEEADGTVDWIESWEYPENGKLTWHSIDEDADGISESGWYFKWLGEELIEATWNHTHYPNRTIVKTYTYDTSGRQKTETITTQDNLEFTTTEHSFYYDFHSRLIRDDHDLDLNGEPDEQTTYDYSCLDRAEP